MADSRFQPNPLRPYYIPATIPKESNLINNSTSTTSPSFNFPDLDYSDYIPEASPSLLGNLKSFVDQALWRYTNTVVAQPFEVAKLILQTRVAQESDVDDAFRGADPARYEDIEVDEEGEEDEDEPNYFTTSAQFLQPPSRSPTRGRRGRPPQQERYPSRRPANPDQLVLKDPHSLLDVLSSLSSSSGTFAIWKATNTTFIYHILLRTCETFLRSFLGAVLGIPDADINMFSTSTAATDSILASTSPLTTVLIATTATTLSALLLSPIDAARTRLILTPSTQESRSLLSTLRTLTPAWVIRAHLIPITFLSSSIPTFLSTTSPFLLKRYLSIDSASSPTTYSVASFLTSTLDLAVKFPLETVLRRAQIATWTAPDLQPPRSKSARKALTTIVPVPQKYKGVGPTIWSIMREEGFSESAKDKTAALMGKAPRRKRKGQGIEGLYRGWRVGLWGLIGIWGTGFVAGLQNGGDDVKSGPHGGKF